MKTHFTSTFTFLLLSILLSTTFSQQEIPRKPEPPKILSFRDPTAASQSPDLEIIPGLTQQLLIKLKGETEFVTFDFRANETDSSLFEIFVFINNYLDKKSYFARFNEPETLAVSIDREAKRCLIKGDKGFSLTSPLEEGDYQVKVSQRRDSEVYESLGQNDIAVEAFDKGQFSNVVITGSVIGSFVLAAFGVRMVMMVRMKRKAIDGDLLVTGKTQHAKEKDCESNDNSQITVTPTRREKAKELSLMTTVAERDLNDCSTTVRGDYEQPAATRHSEKKQKNGAGNVLTVPQQYGNVSNDISMSSSYRMFKAESADVSQLNLPAALHNDCGQKKHQNCGQKFQEVIKRPFAEDKIEDPTPMSLTLDMDDLKTTGRTPTQAAIRALVRKLEEAGELGNDCDPSAESDDEDQYEAPQLPNYFCCMVCFQGKRCTVAKPCQHIFACTKCIDELLDSYKICVLCAKTITGYELL